MTLDQELPDLRGVPRRLTELFTAGQYGGHGAPGLAQRVRGPAAGLPVAHQRVQGRRHGGAGHRPGPGRVTGSLADGPGGALAGPARPGRADRLGPPAPGAGPGRVGPAESPAGPAQPAGQPGQIPAITAGPGDLAGPGSGREHNPGRRARARLRKARTARAAHWQDRHAPALPIGWARPHQGQVPAGWAQRNSRHALHSPLVSLVQVPAVPAGASDLAGLRIAAAAAARPQPHDLLATVRAGSGTGGGALLAAFAPVGEVNRAELAAVRADDQAGPRQPVAAGAQPGGQVRAVLPAAGARPGRPPGAGIAAMTQPGLARPARSSRTRCR